MHIGNTFVNASKTENMQSKFECLACDYRCSRKFLWEQHLTTRKHAVNQKYALSQASKVVPKKEGKISSQGDTSSLHSCDLCGKTYKGRSGLWRHKKKCMGGLTAEDKGDVALAIIEGTDAQDVGAVLKQNEELKSLFKDVLTSLHKDSETRSKDAEVRADLMRQLKEQGKLIKDMVPRMGSNNKSVNISVFLNERCRDAINMSDFIASLEVQAKDLSFTRTNGLIEGISSLFINGLKQLDTFRRPIHCTDALQETLYIKEDNAWEEDATKERVRGAIGALADKHRRAILDWEGKHPGWEKDEVKRAEYINLVQTVMKDFNEANDENVIIKTIAQETSIDSIGKISEN